MAQKYKGQKMSQIGPLSATTLHDVAKVLLCDS